MSRKGWVVSVAWFCFSSVLILLFSVQDKEWLIDSQDVKNICDLMASVEQDDIRDVGLLVTLPLFFPYIYLLARKKRQHGFVYLTLCCLVAFWLWRFFLRYQWCL